MDESRAALNRRRSRPAERPLTGNYNLEKAVPTASIHSRKDTLPCLGTSWIIRSSPTKSRPVSGWKREFAQMADVPALRQRRSGQNHKARGKAHRPGLYQCAECREQFTVTVKTVFERSKIPLTKWLAALFLMTASKKGISAHQVHRMLGVSYKSTWFMMHHLREAMRSGGLEPLGGGGKVVEADEPILVVPRKCTYRRIARAAHTQSAGTCSTIARYSRCSSVAGRCAHSMSRSPRKMWSAGHRARKCRPRKPRPYRRKQALQQGADERSPPQDGHAQCQRIYSRRRDHEHG